MLPFQTHIFSIAKLEASWMHKNMPVFLCDDRTGLRDVISSVVTLSQVPKLIFPLYLDAVGAEAATRTH